MFNIDEAQVPVAGTLNILIGLVQFLAKLVALDFTPVSEFQA